MHKLLAVIILSLFGFCVDLQAQYKITAIDALDKGVIGDEIEASPSVDIVQGLCGTSDEPFHDTILRIKVSNKSSSTISFQRAWFVISNPYGTGGKLTTKRFALVGSAEVESSQTESTALYSLFLDKSGSAKNWAGESQDIPSGLGFRNVRVFLQGKSGRGKRFRISASTAISLDDFERCAS